MSAWQVRETLKIDQKITEENIKTYPDQITFKTEYIAEVPLYDTENQCILPITYDSKLGFKKFVKSDFAIKSNDPLRNFHNDPRVSLSYGIDVLS